MNNRLWKIDFLRGMAVVAMIVYHLFFILDYFRIVPNDFGNFWWAFLARITQFLFIGLVGVSLTLSRSGYEKQVKRGLVVFGLGLLVSFATLFFSPENYVRFGILHFIGIGIILSAPVARKKYWPLFLAFASFCIGFLFSHFTTSSMFLYFLGFRMPDASTFDYFPIFPWISVIFAGIFLGNILQEQIWNESPAPKVISPVIFLGRHSLVTYLAHVPLILAVLLATGLI